MSRGFLCALAGIGVTLLAWFGPWEWPAWPGFTVVTLVFGHGGYLELPFAMKAATLTVLIIINVSFWALVCYGAIVAAMKAVKALTIED